MKVYLNILHTYNNDKNLLVIQYSGVDLYEGFLGHIPHLHVGRPLYIILGAGTIAKFFLWIYCARISKQYNSDMLNALAEDHLNDVLSNTAAIVTAAIAYNTSAWWLDPVGAILISMLIIARWGDIISEQVRKIVGFTAPPEFIKQVIVYHLLSHCVVNQQR